MMAARVGCAGWSLPSAQGESFAGDGTHLQRYAQRLPAVEINSSFYRPHRPATYARWAASVPAHFRFAVKLPKAITHEQRLVGAADALRTFLDAAGELGDKLGCLLVQLPPSLQFEPRVAAAFLKALRAITDCGAVVEPRHATWFTAAAEKLLVRYKVGRVAADPAPVPVASTPGAWTGIAYYRWHGSPRMYYSNYQLAALERLASRLAEAQAAGADAWGIFDNTAAGAAVPNALHTLDLLHAAEAHHEKSRGASARRRGSSGQGSRQT